MPRSSVQPLTNGTPAVVTDWTRPADPIDRASISTELSIDSTSAILHERTWCGLGAATHCGGVVAYTTAEKGLGPPLPWSAAPLEQPDVPPS
jgi:hypothetical protein